VSREASGGAGTVGEMHPHLRGRAQRATRQDDAIGYLTAQDDPFLERRQEVKRYVPVSRRAGTTKMRRPTRPTAAINEEPPISQHREPKASARSVCLSRVRRQVGSA
jgi:hypothetical protein